MLPDRLRGAWNAADIADDVIALGEDPVVFAETRGGTFPRELLYRVFAYHASHLVVDLLDEADIEHSIFLDAVEPPEDLLIMPRWVPEETAAYRISDNPPPQTTIHGDVRYTLDSVLFSSRDS